MYIMDEIINCIQDPDKKNRFKKQYPNINRFKEDYIKLKFIIRRIWFGLDIKVQEEISKIIIEKNLPPEMLVIALKYSCFNEFSMSVFFKTLDLLKANSKIDKTFISRVEMFTDLFITNLKPDNRKIVPLENKKISDKAVVHPLTYSDENTTYDNNFYFSLSMSNTKTIDSNKIAIIFCTNDLTYEKECVLYLRHLQIPSEFLLEILPVRNAPNMACGYNYAISHTNAKYKLYIHHDTFIIQQDILNKIINAFKADADLGMLGIFGSATLNKSCTWYKSPTADNYFNLYQDEILFLLRSVKTPPNGELVNGKAIDGVFMATSIDLPWSEDLFNGWHFYDIAQCYNMHYSGYKTSFIGDDNIWILHENTLAKDPDFKYQCYREFFKLYIKAMKDSKIPEEIEIT